MATSAGHEALVMEHHPRRATLIAATWIFFMPIPVVEHAGLAAVLDAELGDGDTANILSAPERTHSG